MTLAIGRLERSGSVSSLALWEVRDVNTLVGYCLGGMIAIGGASAGLVSHSRPAPPPSTGSAPNPTPELTWIDDQGHVYGARSSAAAPESDGIVCAYTGPRLTAQRPGRDGVSLSCPATPPAEDVIWPSGGEPPLPVDPDDPGIPACRAAGGTPMPPQLGGGGGEGAPVDFCMIAGHLWAPGGQAGAPWGATVAGSAQCSLLGGSYQGADPNRLQGFNCVWEGAAR